MLRLVCCMTSEAGLETVLSAVFSLKHETDLMKTFSTREEAFDKAREMGLTPKKAAKNIRNTPRGRVVFYDETRGEVVKPDDWKPPDLRSLIETRSTRKESQWLSPWSSQMTLVQVISPLLTKLECKLMKMSKQQPRFRMSCVAPLKAISGWPTWKCHQALPPPCLQLQECPENHTQRVQLQWLGISWLASKSPLRKHMLLKMCLGCYEEWYPICLCLLSSQGKRGLHPMWAMRTTSMLATWRAKSPLVDLLLVVIWGQYGHCKWTWTKTCPRLAPWPWLLLCDHKIRVA